jgi:hypothetical protein
VEARVDRSRERLARETLTVPAVVVEVAEDDVPAVADAVISVTTARTTGVLIR